MSNAAKPLPKPPRQQYAESSRREGELKPHEAAELVGTTEKTMRQYARDAASGSPTRLPEARRDAMGRLWIPRRALAGFRVIDPDAAADKW